jgi:hypothetical protein
MDAHSALQRDYFALTPAERQRNLDVSQLPIILEEDIARGGGVRKGAPGRAKKDPFNLDMSVIQSESNGGSSNNRKKGNNARTKQQF